MRLLDDDESQLVSRGSNQHTRTSALARPDTTGGHVDTSGRRMISDIGLEDCCGVLQQWLRNSTTFSLPAVEGTAVWRGSVGGHGRHFGTDQGMLVDGSYADWTDIAGSVSRSTYVQRTIGDANYVGRGCSDTMA